MTWYANSAGRYGLSGAKGDAGEKLVESFCKKNNLEWEDMNDYKSQLNGDHNGHRSTSRRFKKVV